MHPVDRDDLSTLPLFLKAAIFLAGSGLVVWFTYRAEPLPLALPHVALVAVGVLGMVSGFGIGLLRLVPLNDWERRASVAAMAAGGTLLYVIQPGGMGSAGIFATAFASPRLGRFGTVLAILTGAGYAVVQLERSQGSLLTVLISLAGYGAGYGYSTVVRQVRLGQAERLAATERQRLAREIHDVLAHTLSALAVQLEAARLVAEQRPGDPDVVARIDRAHRLTREGLEEARRAVGALRGESLPGPALLSRLAADFERESGVPCRLVVEGTPVELKPDAQLAVYRAAQEALTNVRKHAQPSAVEIRLTYARGGAELTVEDRGAPKPSLASGGFGLAGMRERAELLGGSLEAGPTADGFRLTLRVPAT